MTVPVSTRRAGPYTGNSVTTLFGFTFKVFSASDVQVVRTINGVDTVLASGYTVTLNADQDANPGGSVLYPTAGAPMPSTTKLTLRSATAYTQSADLPGGGRFDPVVVENALDRNVILMQQILEQANRTLTLPVSSVVSGALPAPQGNTVLGWDPLGSALVNLPFLSGDVGNAGNSGFDGSKNYVAATIGAHMYEVVLSDHPWLCSAARSDNWASIEAALDFLESKGGGKLVFKELYPVSCGVRFVSYVEYFATPGGGLISTNASIDNVLGEGYAYIDEIHAAQLAGATWQRLLKPDYSGSMSETEGFITGGYAGKAHVGIRITGMTIDGNKSGCAEGKQQLLGTPVGAGFRTAETITARVAGVVVGTARIATPIGSVGLTFEPRSLSPGGIFPVGAVVTGSASGTTMTVVTAQADDAYQNGIRLDAVSHCVISGCTIRNSVFSALSIYNYSNNVLVTGNFFYGNNKPGTVYTSGWCNIYVEYLTQCVVIAYNVIDGGLGYSCLASASGGLHQDNRWLYNTIMNPFSDGLRIAQDSGTSSQYGTEVHGNTVANVTGVGACGIRVVHNGSAGAIQDGRFTCNTVRTNGASTYGMLFQGRVTRCVAQGNNVTGTNAVAMDFVNGTTLTGNDSTGNTSEGTVIQASQKLSALTTVTAGGATLGLPSGFTVGATPVPIKTLKDANGFAKMWVQGINASNAFLDEVSYSNNLVATVLTTTGAPQARSYTRSGAVISLTIAGASPTSYAVKVATLDMF